ncbi:B-cell receptor CD22-like isoform X2 [Oncorhynchus nerka]|uniref:B-cell receptor CD22-like isoform X2 n=1 Tax=Oncorhynchus nerka TaxID=8023 RepID=UPI0031B89061
MALRTAGSVLVVFLWSVAVVLGQYGGSVTYTKNSICALKGSTVELSCSYTYPRGHRVTTIGWSYWNSGAGRFVEIQSNNEGRVEYRQTTEKDSTLRITDLRQSDKDTYYFRYKTDKSDWKTAQRGVTLSVTELQVEVTGQWNVKTLTCRTSCSLPGNPTYVWYKNRQYLDERTSSIYSNYVYSKDAGSYSCAVKGHEDLHSPAVCVHNSNCWSVTYTKRRICVLKGSTVDISCSYTHPTSYIEQGSFWFTQKHPVDVRSYPESAGRVQYNRNTENHHTMTITHLTEKDSAEYIFRLITTDEGRFSGLPGVMLTVTDILLEMDPTSVSEGERVTLRCRTKCTVGLNPTYIWYKNRQRLTNTITSYNSLILEPISSEDAGNYSCAVEGFERILSTEETLTVRYGPRNTSVSVSPSGEIVEGSSVTLTCSSDANPPVDKYTWYKKNGGHYQSISNQNTGPHHTFNQIKSSDTGEYYCEAQNELGTDRPESINMDVKYGPKNTSVSVSPSGEVVEGSSVTLTCSSDANPPVDKYTWYKKNGGHYQSISNQNTGPHHTFNQIKSSDTGEYYCEAQNELGTDSPESINMDVKYGPKNTSVSVSPSGEIVEGSSVTLTCSSDANPPVDKYTWYKKNLTSPKASGQSYSITNIISEDRGDYYCEAQNGRGSMNSTALMIIVAGKQTSVLTAAVGIIVVVLVLILCLSGLMWFRKKASKPTSNTGDTSENEQVSLLESEGDYDDCVLLCGTFPLRMLSVLSLHQGDSSPVYDNISGMAMTPTAAQTVATDDQDDIHYASVPFQEVLLYSTVQQSQAQEQDEDIQYATLKFNLLSDATW